MCILSFLTAYDKISAQKNLNLGPYIFFAAIYNTYTLFVL